ncbi:hypothetical protein Pmar_PMAR003313 [Perkinsus marinus ATCC 50983]|uniref:Uncharacterized protein n=1 Tax=Perkinsus marinus (strain ATCC 50983 / TXsc) TaxID=423536 RepID=C5KGZ9_PERM5|nr:hypothetical protein Pmar_PMAR003313 [Perkinsus marinus ATCC 50983]EER15861.1 hypothetical protein Pmar_PMAR003313 [Perkinsus marinus ATCC 50983]|eukprot:XP_002784065.1 hypothetical protein Pmar_PMAR003313 [Perkinsus marinus ATCC 50983]
MAGSAVAHVVQFTRGSTQQLPFPEDLFSGKGCECSQPLPGLLRRIPKVEERLHCMSVWPSTPSEGRSTLEVAPSESSLSSSLSTVHSASSLTSTLASSNDLETSYNMLESVEDLRVTDYAATWW